MEEQNDALDSADLNLEDALNELCPDESSLSNLPLLQILLRQRILESTHEITILQSELHLASNNPNDPSQSGLVLIESIQEGIGALLTTLATIRSSSTEAQSVVESITKEIKTLDLTKTNIQTAIDGLKSLGMLVNEFDQLTRLAQSRKYRETASVLNTVQSLSQEVEQLANSVPRVAKLLKLLQETQQLLRTTIMEEFSSAFEQKTVATNKKRLADSCLVMEALGIDTRDTLIEWYTNFQLREYRRIFSGPSSEAGQLDNISRRYAWFRRILKAHEEDPNGPGRIFPESWNVSLSLCGQFGEATRQDLKGVLAHFRPTLKVGILLEALQTTAAFEREMSQKFESMKYDKVTASSKSTQMGSFTPIRTAFEPYLSIFVEAQESALSDMFNSFRSSTPKLSDFTDVRIDDRPAGILPSSMELFHFYRSTLDQCASLTTGKPFLDLCEVYKKWLKVYSEEILTTSLSNAILANSNGSTLAGKVPSFESGHLNPLEGHRIAQTRFLLCNCAILNTADYCAGTCEQLQTRLQEKIDTNLRPQVSLESELDLFNGNISSAISNLVNAFENSCDVAFSSMVRLQWKEIEFVSAESHYVHDLINIITSFTDVIKQHVEHNKYVRTFCDKVVGIIFNRFLRTIVRCRPIPPIAAEQMILDLQVLKNHLSTLPRLKDSSESQSTVPSSYTRYLSKSMGKLDTLLKLIMTPVEPPDQFVKHYLLLIPCQSFSDFQKVLDLKGGKPQDQNAILDVFLAMTSVQNELSDTSFLSTLDMNPEGGGVNHTNSILQFPRRLGNDLGSGMANSSDNVLNRKIISGNHSPHSVNSHNNNNQNNVDDGAAGGGSAFTDFGRRFSQKFGMGIRFNRDS